MCPRSVKQNNNNQFEQTQHSLVIPETLSFSLQLQQQQQHNEEEIHQYHDVDHHLENNNNNIPMIPLQPLLSYQGKLMIQIKETQFDIFSKRIDTIVKTIGNGSKIHSQVSYHQGTLVRMTIHVSNESFFNVLKAIPRLLLSSRSSSNSSSSSNNYNNPTTNATTNNNNKNLLGRVLHRSTKSKNILDEYVKLDNQLCTIKSSLDDAKILLLEKTTTKNERLELCNEVDRLIQAGDTIQRKAQQLQNQLMLGSITIQAHLMKDVEDGVHYNNGWGGCSKEPSFCSFLFGHNRYNSSLFLNSHHQDPHSQFLQLGQ